MPGLERLPPPLPLPPPAALLLLPRFFLQEASRAAFLTPSVPIALKYSSSSMATGPRGYAATVTIRHSTPHCQSNNKLVESLRIRLQRFRLACPDKTFRATAAGLLQESRDNKRITIESGIRRIRRYTLQRQKGRTTNPGNTASTHTSVFAPLLPPSS